MKDKEELFDKEILNLISQEEEFDKLKEDIEKKMDELEELQREYRKLTGRDFVKPIRW
jgi:uncharacterized protein HemX